jgi:hypothetical protein
LRALQLYTPNTADKAAYASAIDKALAWILNTKARGNDDRAWRLTALAWGGKRKDAIQSALRELLATQKANGGWSDIDTMESSVYATGRALYGLQVAGVPASNTAYQRGVQYLLKAQQEDGSWFVQSRALAFQPYFDAGFPHGYNQWISAAGTSWAVRAELCERTRRHDRCRQVRADACRASGGSGQVAAPRVVGFGSHQRVTVLVDQHSFFAFVSFRGDLAQTGR